MQSIAIRSGRPVAAFRLAATSTSSLKLRSSVIRRLLIKPFCDLGENRTDFSTRFLRRATLQAPHRHPFRNGFGIAVPCNNGLGTRTCPLRAITALSAFVDEATWY